MTIATALPAFTPSSSLPSHLDAPIKPEKTDPSAYPPRAAAAKDVSAAPVLAPAPNSGLHAWLNVLGAFMVFFNTWGILNTFGVFQTYYESGVLFQESSSNISWVGAMQAFLVMIGGLVSGPLYDKGKLSDSRPVLTLRSTGSTLTMK